MQTSKNWIAWIFNGVAGVFTYLQPTELLQIICMAMTIVSVIISSAFSIYKWYKKAIADNRITEEEIDELATIISTRIGEVQDTAEKIEAATKSVKGDSIWRSK